MGKLKKGRLSEIVKELQGASKMHLKQSEKIQKHIEDMESPVKMRKTTKGEDRTFRTEEEGAGMTEKGVKDYKKENPGSNLQTAVTGDVEPGSKDAKRRKSFCARSKGWTGERGKAARARWKC